MIAAFVCTLAIQTATTRMIFSMSRDACCRFPTGSARWRTNGARHRRGGRRGAGRRAAAGQRRQPGVFLALTSVCIMLLYMAYLMVTVPLLVRRLSGWWSRRPETVDEDGKALFSLGRWGLPINIVAVVWGFAMVVNLGWPRAGDLRRGGRSSLPAVLRRALPGRLGRRRRRLRLRGARRAADRTRIGHRVVRPSGSAPELAAEGASEAERVTGAVLARRSPAARPGRCR